MKYLKKILLFIIFVAFLFVLYVELGGRYILNTTDKRVITWYIRSSNKLPENFNSFYNTVYPKSLSQNSWSFLGNTIINPTSQKKECPCNQMVNTIFPRLEYQNKVSFDQFLIARYIEHSYSQKDCLNFNFRNFDFLENRKGIENVSKSLFNKEVKDLQPIEIAEILALYENPVKNNRYRNPERTKNRTKHFYNLYSKNLKK
ncbi:transglycosylase domain-containing protein [Chryseobacterium aureum]|uniref:transglycosylase domain-containing protein n=1 Tax=Chryseobacterium aureum TaxID=2497456 RepID=UPI000F89BACE|nr:transglycosylase domain-containing protein [Chryseobacterium aureum]